MMHLINETTSPMMQYYLFLFLNNKQKYLICFDNGLSNFKAVSDDARSLLWSMSRLDESRASLSNRIFPILENRPDKFYH